MKRFYLLLPGFLLALFLVVQSANAQVSSSTFSVSSGTYTPITSPTTLISNSSSGTYNDNVAGGPTNIGFTFIFGGASYTQFSVNASGLMVLGTTTSTSYSNSLAGSPIYPIIAPFWYHMHLYDGGCVSPLPGVYYTLTGSTPNRVLTVEWRAQLTSGGTYYWTGCATPMMNFQVKLYEGTNKIEFHYGALYVGLATSVSIGLATSTSDFVSVTPSGSSASKSTSTANNSINFQTSGITNGTIYTFDQCFVGISGTTAQGGTTTMQNGDVLLGGKQVQRGVSQPFQPFTIATGIASACPFNYSYELSGTYASDYQITPTSGTLSGPNQSNKPTLTFTPTGVGVRNATLTVNFGVETRTYLLRGEGTTRINWIPNLTQGGTPGLNNGDTLLANLNVVRKTTQTFTPMTIQNFSTNNTIPPAVVTYTINDPTGQYSILPPNTLLDAQQSNTPVITFSPTGVGPQSATLTVYADAEIRTFVLYAFSAAPGADFIYGGQKLGPGTPTFVNETICVGEVASTHTITVNNIGIGDVLITDIKFYRTDTVYQQGTPIYPLIHDGNGEAIPMNDYFITTQPGVAPWTAGQMPTLPILVPDKQSRTIYITFIGNYPGKRFGRAYIQTNGQNFAGKDVDGNDVEGLLNFDVLARARGTVFTDNPNGGLPKPLVFPETRVGDSVDMTFSFTNPGFCDLRISKQFLQIISGDVNEFRLISAFNGIPVNGNDFIFGNGVTGTITARFLPSRAGSRRASLRMKTNDSTIYFPGVTERGTYYVDLFGYGAAGLDVKDVTFDPAVIDATTSTAATELSNNSTINANITAIAISGPDAAEFAEDAFQPWPPLPYTMKPGEILSLSMVHTPTAGSLAGPRQAILTVTMASGQAYMILLNGEAVTRLVTVPQASISAGLFANKTVRVGKLARQTIEIRNTGTTVLTIQQPTLSGANPSDFSLQILPRLEIDPGASEFLEVTYAPTGAGNSMATVDILSNATNGAQAVQLNATASRTSAGGDADNDNASLSSVGSESVTRGGVVLRQSTPNPASGKVEIGYRLPASGSVELKLYDSRGVEVRTLERGQCVAGEYVVQLDVSGLASGVYHYRIVVNGEIISRTVTVTR